MAYWITHIDKNNFGLRRFQCDYESDISKLPTKLKPGVKQKNDTVSNRTCAAGSQCFCHESSSIYVLGQEIDKWTKINSSVGSGNSGSGGMTEEDVEPISDETIESLFL